jgi:hypothetical protein
MFEIWSKSRDANRKYLTYKEERQFWKMGGRIVYLIMTMNVVLLKSVSLKCT